MKFVIYRLSGESRKSFKASTSLKLYALLMIVEDVELLAELCTSDRFKLSVLLFAANSVLTVNY